MSEERSNIKKNDSISKRLARRRSIRGDTVYTVVVDIVVVLAGTEDVALVALVALVDIAADLITLLSGPTIQG